jgi:hypothetical protein
MEQVSLAAAAKQFFGLLPGQALMDFHTEWKKLTEKDKAEIKAEFLKAGIPVKE